MGAETVETGGLALDAELNNGSTPVLDLGWHDPDDAFDPLITDLPNEGFWKLIRRFNKQTYHVKSTPQTPTNGLDLEISADETLTPIKFKTHLERLYMTAVVGAFHLWKHIVRLRSWREWNRTSAFLGVYAVAWACDALLASFLSFLVVLILVPEARGFCFPPAPPSLIDGTTGGAKKPMAGVLGSGDSLTGAPEKHPGEAVEQEAHSFVSSVITLAVGLAGDRNPQDFDDMKYKTGNVRSVEQDKTKKPVSDAVFGEAAVMSHFIAILADTYERFGNALSPTAPFPKRRPRVILASCLLPFIVVLQVFSSYELLKGIGFLVGLAFFGDPILRRVVEVLDQRWPGWKIWLDPRNTILRDVPTDIQLALTLLRSGEAAHAPLPPAPSKREPPKMEAPPNAAPALSDTLGIDQADVTTAMQPDPQKKAEAQAGPREQMSKKHNRLLNFVKGLVKGGVHSGIAADRAVSHMGSEKAKYRAGVVRKGPTPRSGPDRFAARYEGKEGFVHVNTSVVTPTLGWGGEGGDLKWAIEIEAISEIQKIGGLGWKTKIAVSWATDDEVMDGILIKTVTGDEFHLTAMPSRDELFNRLVAIGARAWKEL